MSTRCPSCGVEVNEGVKFCPECGHKMPVASPAIAPAATPTSSAPSPENAAGGSPTPVVTPGPTPAPVSSPTPAPVTTTYAQPAGAAPTGTAPASPAKGMNMKLVAGCGAAGCLFILLITIIAIVIIVTMGDDNPQGGGGGNGGGGGGRGTPVSNDRGGAENGPLSKLVQKEVGKFKLVKAVQNQEVIGNGAIDAMDLEYKAPDGTAAYHVMVAHRNPDNAKKHLDGFIKALTDKGATVKNRQPLRNDAGEVGEAVMLEGQGEFVLWTNGQLLLAVGSTAGNAVEFFNNVKY